MPPELRSIADQDVAKLRHVLHAFLEIEDNKIEDSIEWKALKHAGVKGFEANFLSLTSQDFGNLFIPLGPGNDNR